MKADVDKLTVAAGERFFVWQTIYAYQTMICAGRLRFHIFHREDPGEAFHDHRWDFWTFPLTSYVEEVLLPDGLIDRRVVPALCWSFRKAEHTHRVVGRAAGRPGKVVTFVWRGPIRRDWKYVNVIRGRAHRLPWRRYLEIADRT